MRFLSAHGCAQGKQWVLSLKRSAADLEHMQFPWPTILLKNNEYEEVNAPPTCTLIGRVCEIILSLGGFISYIL